MILVTELAAAPILSKADPDVLALVAQSAADIPLAAGEYAVHEGDERALYVVLSGHIQVTKRSRVSNTSSASDAGARGAWRSPSSTSSCRRRPRSPAPAAPDT